MVLSVCLLAFHCELGVCVCNEHVCLLAVQLHWQGHTACNNTYRCNRAHPPKHSGAPSNVHFVQFIYLLRRNKSFFGCTETLTNVGSLELVRRSIARFLRIQLMPRSYDFGQNPPFTDEFSNTPNSSLNTVHFTLRCRRWRWHTFRIECCSAKNAKMYSSTSIEITDETAKNAIRCRNGCSVRYENYDRNAITMKWNGISDASHSLRSSHQPFARPHTNWMNLTVLAFDFFSLFHHPHSFHICVYLRRPSSDLTATSVAFLS